MKKRFRINKEFKYIKRYDIVTPSLKEQISEKINLFLSTISKKKDTTKKSKQHRDLDRLGSFVVVLMFIIFIIAPIFYFIYLIHENMSVIYTKPSLNVILLNSYFSDFGNRLNKEHAIVYRLKIVGDGEKVVNTYRLKSPLLSNVYIVQPYEEHITNYDEYKTMLIQELEQLGFSVSFIHMGSLHLLPSGSIVVIPTGLNKPNNGLYNEIYKSTNMNKTLYIFYIGSNPTIELDTNGITQNYEDKWLKNYGLKIEPVADTVSKNLHVITPTQFKISGTKLNDNFYTLYTFDHITFIFLPVSIDQGWKNGSDAANDFITIFNERKWINYTDTLTFNVSNEVDYYFSPSTLNNTIYSLVLVKAHNKRYTQYYYIPLVDSKAYSGYLYADRGPVLLPYYVSNTQELYEVYIPGNLREDVYIKAIDQDGNVQQLDIFKEGVQEGSSYTFTYGSNELTKGGYILQGFKKKDNTLLFRSYIEFGNFNISYKVNKNHILFYFFVDNKPVRVDNVKIQYKSQIYSFHDVKIADIDTSNIFGGNVPVGKHKFKVILNKQTYDINVVVRAKTGLANLFNPLNIGILVVSAIIYGFGIFFARREEEQYVIDIPDFPPIESIKIPITTKKILDLIKDTNTRYKWEYTPLTIEEFKEALKQIEYKGKSIYASDYNIAYILDKLVKRNILGQYEGYYGIKNWEKDTGFNISQLAIYRKIRDICIENAIPFTKLNRKRGYHVKIKTTWTNFYIYIYDRKELNFILTNIDKYIKKGIPIIIFKNEREKYEFINKINGDQLEKVHMRFYISTGKVLLFLLKEFEEKINVLKA